MSIWKPLSIALAIAIPASACALTLSFWGGNEIQPLAAPRPVVTEIVSGSLASERTVPGVVAAATEVQMAFQTLGRMVERRVDVGDRVNQGEVLARLDPEDLAGSVRSAEAALAAALVNLETAQNTAKRARALTERNVASTAQLEQAEQVLAAAQSAVDETRAQLESARDAEGFTMMTAPITGVISAVAAAPGAVVAAGDPIMTLSSEDKLEARIDLTETQLLDTTIGVEVIVRRARDGDESVRGKVERIAPVADAQTRTRRVFIALPDNSGLRLGSLIRVNRVGDVETMLTVPRRAIVKSESGNALWVVSRNGDEATVALRQVETADTTGGRTTITKGLSEGEEVVIRGVHSLTDGQNVGRRVDP